MKSFYSSDISRTRTSSHGYFCDIVCALMFLCVCVHRCVCAASFTKHKRPNRRPKGMCWHYSSSHWPGWWYGKSKLVVLIVLSFFKYALTTHLRTCNSPFYWIRPSTLVHCVVGTGGEVMVHEKELNRTETLQLRNSGNPAAVVQNKP